MKIKIDRATIKKNPTAGNTSTTISNGYEISFLLHKEMPPTLQEGQDYIITSQSSKRSSIHLSTEYFIEGILLNESKIGILKGVSAAITYDNKLITYNHLPEPDYLFKYENPKIKCSECGSLIKVNDIKEDYVGEDEIYVETCPVCGNSNTFEEREYENINDVVKELTNFP